VVPPTALRFLASARNDSVRWVAGWERLLHGWLLGVKLSSFSGLSNQNNKFS
jgi:hypothetical protein